MKIISTIVLAVSALLICVSCDDNDQFTEEQYKKVIYLLSRDNNKVFPGIHTLNEEVSTGYVTIGAGGSLVVDEDVTVEFERDDSLMKVYNKVNFDIATEKYARELDPGKFDIEHSSITLKAGQDYGLLPIRVHAEGLSPDSIYFIPLRIKSISNYEVNPDYKAVLYRVYLENDYASQQEQTSYSVRGSKKEEGAVASATITLNKRAYPLTKDKFRIFADMKNSSDKLNEINQFSIVLQVNEDESITITSYKPELLEVEPQYEEEGDNWYRPDILGVKRMYINYKYRTRDSADAAWSAWTMMSINLKRVE